MKIRAVIGAGWGDCGKGRMTDHFADENSIVVRSNGGSQAGHTVVTSRDRHVFSHMGAGAFSGAATYLSKFFVSNPIVFAKEIGGFGHSLPEIYVNPHSFVTTPWDMMLNMAIEQSRGDERHGSCGHGVNETVVRNSTSMPLNVQMLRSEGLNDILQHIRNDYVRKRLDELGVEPSEELKGWMADVRTIDRFLVDIEHFLCNVTVGDPIFKDYGNVIFEGAQGLMLDQNHESFPHVTRSNTGVQNVQHIMEDFGMHDDLEVTYVTRFYATRHGEGPFPTEIAKMTYPDPTNIYNKNQGSLRFGLLDIDRLVLEVSKDMGKLRIPFNPSIAVTCLDQGMPKFIEKGMETTATRKDFCRILADKLNFSTVYGSYGPAQNDIMETWTREAVAA